MNKAIDQYFDAKTAGRNAIIIFAVTLVVGFAGVSATKALSADSVRSVIPVFTEDHLPNETATDWVTYADFVVAVTATSEREVKAPSDPNAEESTIGREVTLRVNDVLWSRDPKAKAPKTVPWSAIGWGATGGDLEKRQEMVEVGASRVEVGHSYVIAIKWELPLCTEGPDKESAQWSGLGAGAVVPFDEGIVGNGEFEGKTRSAAQAKVSVKRGDLQPTFANTMLGKSSTALAQNLGDTKPDPDPENFRPTPVC